MLLNFFRYEPVKKSGSTGLSFAQQTISSVDTQRHLSPKISMFQIPCVLKWMKTLLLVEEDRCRI